MAEAPTARGKTMRAATITEVYDYFYSSLDSDHFSLDSFSSPDVVEYPAL